MKKRYVAKHVTIFTITITVREFKTTLFFYKCIYTHAWFTNVEMLTLYCNNNTEMREEKKCKPQEHKVALHMMENWYTNRSQKINCSDRTNAYINTLQLSG